MGITSRLKAEAAVLRGKRLLKAVWRGQRAR
jgi:hypothetical protein